MDFRQNGGERMAVDRYNLVILGLDPRIIGRPHGVEFLAFCLVRLMPVSSTGVTVGSASVTVGRTGVPLFRKSLSLAVTQQAKRRHPC